MNRREMEQVDLELEIIELYINADPLTRLSIWMYLLWILRYRKQLRRALGWVAVHHPLAFLDRR